MTEDFQYRTKRMQLLAGQIEWMIRNQQIGIEPEALAERMQLGKWEVQHLFQEYLKKDPMRFIRDAFTPSLLRAGEMDQVSIFDAVDLPTRPVQAIDVIIELLDSPEVINYSKFDYFLGELFIASTAQGICQITFEDSENGFSRLKKTFPNALLVEERDSIQELALNALNCYFSGGNKAVPAIPVALKASSMQFRIWKQIGLLKPGELATYEMLAVALGDKNARKVIGSVVMANPVALLIPCHRVIPRNGKAGNYRWQSWRKQTLLAIEK